MATESSPLRPIIAQAAAEFAKHRDIHTVGDLLAFWPRRYRSRESDLGAVEVGQFLVGVAEVKSARTRPMQRRKGTMLEAVITDGRHGPRRHLLQGLADTRRRSCPVRGASSPARSVGTARGTS